MHPIRKLRLERGLRITELAIMSGVPARALGAAEQGLATLSPSEQELLERALQVSLGLPVAPASRQSRSHWRAFAIASICVVLLGVVGLFAGEVGGQPHQPLPAHAAAARPTVVPPDPTKTATPVIELVSAQAAISNIVAAPTGTPTTTAIPAEHGMPSGCPLLADPERVRVTQGYGVGTHAPASTAGALDLGVDGDGDGYADPGSTSDAVVLATHAGIAHLYPNSWPGGNVVRIIDETSGWSTLYAHLALFGVNDGERVEAGTPIGRVGSTGMADGPHLHYEIWFQGENRDPSAVEGCWR